MACLLGLPEIRTMEHAQQQQVLAAKGMKTSGSGALAGPLRSLPQTSGCRALSMSRSCSAGFAAPSGSGSGTFPASSVQLLPASQSAECQRAPGRIVTLESTLLDPQTTSASSDLITPTLASLSNASSTLSCFANPSALDTWHCGAAASEAASATDFFSISTVLTSSGGGRSGPIDGMVGPAGAGSSGGNKLSGDGIRNGGSSDRQLRRERHRRAAASAESWHHPAGTALFRPACLASVAAADPRLPGSSMGARGFRGGRRGGGQNPRALRLSVECGEEDYAGDEEGISFSSVDEGCSSDDDMDMLGNDNRSNGHMGGHMGPSCSHPTVPAMPPICQRSSSTSADKGDDDDAELNGVGGGIRRMTLSSCCSPVTATAATGGRGQEDEFETPPLTPDGKTTQ